MVDRMCENNVGSLVVVSDGSERAHSESYRHNNVSSTSSSMSVNSSTGGSASIGNKVVGIVTERDFLKKMSGRCRETTLVQDIMTPSVKTVSADISIQDCMEVNGILNFRVMISSQYNLEFKWYP